MFRRIPWQDVCKFLAGAFFVNTGVLVYLYLAGVSVQLLGTNFIETSEISGVRSIPNAVLFVTFFYLGSFESGKTAQSAEPPFWVSPFGLPDHLHQGREESD